MILININIDVIKRHKNIIFINNSKGSINIGVKIVKIMTVRSLEKVYINVYVFIFTLLKNFIQNLVLIPEEGKT
jgi:hypothetical protein